MEIVRKKIGAKVLCDKELPEILNWPGKIHFHVLIPPLIVFFEKTFTNST